MGLRRPRQPDIDADDSVQGVDTNQSSLLASEKGTNKARRLVTDADRNLLVNDRSSDAVLNNGSESNVTVTTLTTIVTYTATADKSITRVSCSGTVYAKFYLVLNTTTIEILRSGPSRNIEFGSLSIDTGDILDVKVEHFYTGQQEDFESTIYGK